MSPGCPPEFRPLCAAPGAFDDPITFDRAAGDAPKQQSFGVVEPPIKIDAGEAQSLSRIGRMCVCVWQAR